MGWRNCMKNVWVLGKIMIERKWIDKEEAFSFLPEGPKIDDSEFREKYQKTINFPFRLPSPNQTISEHWATRAKRNKKLSTIIRMLWKRDRIDLKPPCDVFLCRVAPKPLDEHDNLRTAFKPVVDIVADLLCPGLAAGQADSDSRIGWRYEQRKGPYAIEIRIQPKI